MARMGSQVRDRATNVSHGCASLVGAHGAIALLDLPASADALAGATARKPVKRKTADRAFAGFMERVDIVREDSHYIFKVSKVTLFGSYLTDAGYVSDVDLLIEYAPQEKDPIRLIILLQQRSDDAERAGRQFNTFVDCLEWPLVKVKQFLKNRSPVLSFCARADDCVLENSRVV